MIKKISYFSLCLFVIFSFIYIKKKYYNSENEFQTVTLMKSKTINKTPLKQQIVLNKSPSFDANNSPKDKAWTEIVINKETGEEEFKVHLPKGKRLYDEEKMKEIAAAASDDTNEEREAKLQ